MNKKLLVAAVGAALGTMPALYAQADVKIGGHAQVEIANEEVKSGTGATSLDRTTFEDNARGRFWITASEDLGGGMKGLAHYEFKLDTTGENAIDTDSTDKLLNTSASTNIREKWVGLQGGFGTIKLGSVKSPYKYAGGVTWDAFVTTNMEARGNGGMSGGVFGHNNFFDNSINYQSNNFGGLTFGITYSLDENPTAVDLDGDGVATDQVSTAEDGDYAAAVEWKGGGLHIVGAVAHNDGPYGGGTPTVASAADSDSTKLGARYNFGNFSVIGQLENVDPDGPSETDIMFLGFQAKMANWLWVLQYGNSETDPGGVETDYLALGGFYNFSKTFSAFGGYRETDPDGPAETTALSFGLRKVF